MDYRFDSAIRHFGDGGPVLPRRCPQIARCRDQTSQCMGGTDHTWMYVGARVLEGGADNDDVNTFATFAYAVGGFA